MLLLSASILQGGGVNQNGTLILHTNPQLTYTTDQNDYCGQAGLAACSLAVSSVPYDGTTRVFHVVAAFPDTSQPRLKAVAWGVAYDPAKVVIAAHGPCGTGEFDIPDAGWPGNGTGIGQSWTAARTSILNEIYWFAGYAYGAADTTSLRLTPHPVQGGLFVDDSAPPAEDLIAGYGWMGFGMGGSLPCPGGAPEGGEQGGGDDGEGSQFPEGEPVRGDLTFVELNTSSDETFMVESRALERDHHLHILVGLSPDGLICRADADQRTALAEDARVGLVTDAQIPGLPEVSTGDRLPGDLGYAACAWNAMLAPTEPGGDGLKLGETFPPCIDEVNDAGPTNIPERQTSIYMMGDVGVSLLFMESEDDGPCDPPNSYTENWTAGERAWAAYQVTEGLRQLADLAPDADLTFYIRETQVLSTSVEPIQLSSADTTWKSEAMDQLQMPPGRLVNRNFALNNLRRSDPEAPTDWWFTAYIVRDVCDPDHRFANGVVSYASFHGPQTTLLYQNGFTYGSAYLGNITAHEVAHVFGAADEYTSGCSCASPYGYLQVVNGNCQHCADPHVSCLMTDCHDFTLCPFTRGQIGWRDSDDPPDHIFDPIDHPASGASMRIGLEEPLGLGDWVDIYAGGTWVKRLAATDWTMDRGQLLWDGIKFDGTAAATGSYDWNLRGGPRHTGTLAVDTQAPVISDLVISPGPGLHDTLRFEFSDADTRSGRVRAIASMPGVADQRVIRDKYYRDTDGAEPPVTKPFAVVHEGLYTLSLHIWDVGAGQYDSESITFWSGDAASADGRRIHVPELALSRGRPNPSVDWIAWDLERATSGVVDLRVVTADGRRVRSWPGRSVPAGMTRILWNGLDDRGARVPSGKYFLVATDGAGHATSSVTTIIR